MTWLRSIKAQTIPANASTGLAVPRRKPVVAQTYIDQQAMLQSCRTFSQHCVSTAMVADQRKDSVEAFGNAG